MRGSRTARPHYLFYDGTRVGLPSRLPPLSFAADTLGGTPDALPRPRSGAARCAVRAASAGSRGAGGSGPVGTVATGTGRVRLRRDHGDASAAAGGLEPVH